MTDAPDQSREDPIVEQVRRDRERLLRESGGTLDSLCEMLEERQAREPGGTVRVPPRRAEPPGSEASGDQANDAA